MRAILARLVPPGRDAPRPLDLERLGAQRLAPLHQRLAHGPNLGALAPWAPAGAHSSLAGCTRTHYSDLFAQSFLVDCRRLPGTVSVTDKRRHS